MMGKTHLVVGVLILFALNRYTDFLNRIELLSVFVILFASVLPDIDQSKSIVGRKFKFVSWVFKHRGFFHSIFAMVLFTVIVQIIFNNQNLSIVFLLGYASHLILDSLTKQGTQLFYPNKLKIKGHLKVGSKLETAIFLIFLAVVVYSSTL